MTRKRSPNIPKAKWDAVKVCYLSGMNPKEIAKRFKLEENTVYTKIGKSGWHKLKKTAVTQGVTEDAIEKIADMLEEDWKEKGATHRSMIYQIASKALKTSSLPAPRSWKDAQIADSMARKAIGLDEEKGSNAIVNIGWMQSTLGGPARVLNNDILDTEFELESVSESTERGQFTE